MSKPKIERWNWDISYDRDQSPNYYKHPEGEWVEYDTVAPLIEAAWAMLPDWDDTSGSTSRVYAMNDHCQAIAKAICLAAGVERRSDFDTELAEIRVNKQELKAIGWIIDKLEQIPQSNHRDTCYILLIKELLEKVWKVTLK